MFNALSGAVDVVNEELAALLAPGREIRDADVEPRYLPVLKERGYLFESCEAEEKAFERLAKTSIEGARKSFSLLICPTYFCNLSCDYCFEGQANKRRLTMSRQMLASALSFVEGFIRSFVGGGELRIGLFGGEPFLAQNLPLVELILSWAKSLGIRLGSPTNATELTHFYRLFEKYSSAIRSIQVTIDGDEREHNRRRGITSSKGFNPFKSAVRSISVLLELGIAVFLRVNVDALNIRLLPAVAELVDANGWRRYPNFKAGLALVTDHKSPLRPPLLREDEAYRTLMEIESEHPELVDVFELSMLRLLSHLDSVVRTGRGASPRGLYCEACSGQLVLGADGLMYACTELMLSREHSVGMFYPTVKLSEDAIRAWSERTVLSMAKCRKCPLALVCGGGCAVSSLFMHGDLNEPYCAGVFETVEGYIRSRFC